MLSTPAAMLGQSHQEVVVFQRADMHYLWYKQGKDLHLHHHLGWKKL